MTTRETMDYEVEIEGWSQTIRASSLDEAEEIAEDMARDDEWGDEGAEVTGWVRGPDGDQRDITVAIEPHHGALIQAAEEDCADQCAPLCGYDPEDHEWTGEGEGGCDENPGVWATGGTSLQVDRHCRRCPLHRRDLLTGTQKNPGEHDRVEYRVLDADEVERLRECGAME